MSCESTTVSRNALTARLPAAISVQKETDEAIDEVLDDQEVVSATRDTVDALEADLANTEDAHRHLTDDDLLLHTAPDVADLAKSKNLVEYFPIALSFLTH